jgi:hypothetical protein
MKTGYALATATLMALGVQAPALADDDGRRWDNSRWSDDLGWDNRGRNDGRWNGRSDRRDEARAYRQGYRDGRRADDRRDRFQGQSWRQADSGWWTDDRDNWAGARGYRAPAWRGAAANGPAPYWWGSNGQLQCRRQDGTTGLIVGALAGGTLGNVIAREGDKRLGSVIGGTLGAVLGNELARGDVRCR